MKVANLLENKGFEAHAIVKTNARDFSLDFVKYFEGKPIIVAEVSEQKSELKGESIAYKAIKLKESFPEIKIFAIVTNKMVNCGKTAILNECDNIFFIEDLEQLRYSETEFLSPIPQGVDIHPNLI